MGEPERRRRRLRSPSSGASAAPDAGDQTAGPAGTAAVADPAEAPLRPADPGRGGAEAPVPDSQETRPATGWRTRAATGSETPPAAGWDTRPATGSGTRPAAGWDTRPATGSETRPAGGERPARPPRGGYAGRRPTGPGTDDREVQRGLRGLVGAGSSQVSVEAALRARDAARPTEQDLADADRDLTIVRRNWVPREDLPRNR